MLSNFSFMVKTIVPFTQQGSIPKTIFPIFTLFQHSNWGEAPNLSFIF
ncbi:hypothetical protein D1AOALGA4SA_305 [Olavius algarvensis Delta 1 endosymbiont]|nr:hypothetical protein D1AOALGA4SA_305 [Olavius algarvensis Delta 1 endosymbiont]